MKFGKHIQKRQLDIPEYAASFVNYKALKKLIKKLSATPTLPPQHGLNNVEGRNDAQVALQANKATFFFRLERELEKVNAFYLQKEAELKLRLRTLLDKKKLMQSRAHTASKLSTTFVALEEGFQQFGNDLNKLQQFVEVNATAFSKILKKWDKTSKSRTKELYLSRAVDVQPCFNREVISELSDQATTSLLELGAWAEGEKIQLDATGADYVLVGQPITAEEDECDSHLLEAVNAGNLALSQDWITRLKGLQNAKDHMTRIFLAAIAEAPDDALSTLLQTDLVDIHAEDEINERNCLHEAAIFGRPLVLQTALARSVDVARVDVYGRMPLHYACMHGRIDVVEVLIGANPATLDAMDHDRFTPLLHAIVHGKLSCVQKLLSYHARINPSSESDHIPLNRACQHGFVDIVRLLLESQARVLPDAEGLFPQHLVARSGQTPDLLLLLREFGADLDEVDKLNQWTPLFHAASEGHVACLRTLLENGARVDILDEKKLSAMYYAAWEGHLECMRLLGSAGGVSGPARPAAPSQSPARKPIANAATSMSTEADGIPDLSLPPPFIPLRRYGHNFLDSKTFIHINFGDGTSDAIVFYNGGKYPAARLTISSKVSDLIPRNIPLPLQEEGRTISFQIDQLDSFTIDFDIFPTFGAKIIAKTVAPSDIFSSAHHSSSHCCLPLFDPRLRAIGQITFGFQVIKPFQGPSLEITDFATYWKATTHIDSHPTAPITDSSLSSQYVRLYVQLTNDLVPVLHSRWCISHRGIEFPISHLTYEQFVTIGSADSSRQRVSALSAGNLTHASEVLAGSFLSLRDALSQLSSSIHVDLHVMYPPVDAQRAHGSGSLSNLNQFADAILKEVFDHSRHLRNTSPDFMRSIILSSYSADVCTAMNWKQPNYPVFLCNNLGRDQTISTTHASADFGSGGNALSIKEAVKIAQNNNFMGLICYSSLLNMVPALIESIRAAGLLLVTDTTGSSLQTPRHPTPSAQRAGIDGVLSESGILRFGPMMG